jgi:NADPH-dependent curcumin reductase CurA
MMIVSSGSTAYGGLLDVLQPKPKQTLFVSGVAGGMVLSY